MKKYLAIICCAAVLCSMLIIPSEAASVVTLNYCNESYYDLSSSAFGTYRGIISNSHPRYWLYVNTNSRGGDSSDYMLLCFSSYQKTGNVYIFKSPTVYETYAVNYVFQTYKLNNTSDYQLTISDLNKVKSNLPDMSSDTTVDTEDIERSILYVVTFFGFLFLCLKLVRTNYSLGGV